MRNIYTEPGFRSLCKVALLVASLSGCRHEPGHISMRAEPDIENNQAFVDNNLRELLRANDNGRPAARGDRRRCYKQLVGYCVKPAILEQLYQEFGENHVISVLGGHFFPSIFENFAEDDPVYHFRNRPIAVCELRRFLVQRDVKLYRTYQEAAQISDKTIEELQEEVDEYLERDPEFEELAYVKRLTFSTSEEMNGDEVRRYVQDYIENPDDGAVIFRDEIDHLSSEELDKYNNLKQGIYNASWTRIKRENRTARSNAINETPEQRRLRKDAVRSAIKQIKSKERCFWCHELPAQGTELKMCTQCSLAVYCSKQCQRAHWRASHKEECEPR